MHENRLARLYAGPLEQRPGGCAVRHTDGSALAERNRIRQRVCLKFIAEYLFGVSAGERPGNIDPLSD
jgi:hypothetical protein